MIGLPEKNETVANFLVDYSNTLTLIFLPCISRIYESKSQNNPFVFFFFWFSFPSVFLYTTVQHGDVKHCEGSLYKPCKDAQ